MRRKILISPAHYLLDYTSRSEFYFAGKLIHDLALRRPDIDYYVICGKCNNPMPENVYLYEVLSEQNAIQLNLFSRISFYFKVFIKSIYLCRTNQFDLIWHIFPNGRFSYNPFLFFQIDRYLNPSIKRAIGRLQYAKHDITADLSGYHVQSIDMRTVRTGRIAAWMQKRIFSLLGSFSNYYFNLFDILIFNNQTAVDHYLRYSIRNLTKPYVKIPVGVDTSAFSFTKKTIEKQKQLLYAGVLDENKRVSEVLNICSHLLLLGENFHLDIVGDGDQRKDLEAQTKRLGLENNVKFWGNIPKNKMGEFYERAHYLFSLSASESFGQVFIESWSTGTIFIGSTIPVYKEVIVDSENGLLFDVEKGDHNVIAKKIKEMKQDEFDRIVRTAHAHVSAYDWGHVIQDYDEKVLSIF